MLFKYHARNEKAEAVDGTIEGSDEQDAVKKLQGQGLYVVSVEMMGIAKPGIVKEKEMTDKNIPLGLKLIIGLFAFLEVCILIFLSVATLFAPSGWIEGFTLFHILLILLIIFPLVIIWLFQLKRIGLYCAWVLFLILGLFQVWMMFICGGAFFTLGGLIRAAICGIVLFYLARPEVKELFE